MLIFLQKIVFPKNKIPAPADTAPQHSKVQSLDKLLAAGVYENDGNTLKTILSPLERGLPIGVTKYSRTEDPGTKLHGRIKILNIYCIRVHVTGW